MSCERISWIAHRGLAIQNPIPSGDLDHIVDACPLGTGDLAVDLGCGTGELLARLASRWHCRAIGIDQSALAIQAASRRSDAVAWRVADGRDHQLAPGTAALAASVGATHVFGSLGATLAAITALVHPGGLVIVGDGYWRADPPDEWLDALGARRDELGDRGALLTAIETAGLRVEYAVDASPSDIDTYNDRWRANLERHLHARPDDPDGPEIADALEYARRWHPDCGRYLGFAMLVARGHQHGVGS